MSSFNSSFSTNSQIKDPTEAALELAEKIISSLSDQSIVSRYFEQKQKIMNSSSRSSSSSTSNNKIDTGSAYQSYQKFVEENNTIKEEIYRLKANKPDFSSSPNNEEIAKLLHEMQVNTFNASPSSIENATTELEKLKRVIEAKFDSLSFILSGLKHENAQFKKQWNECVASCESRLEAAKEKETHDDIKFEEDFSKLQNSIKEHEDQLLLLRQEHQKAIEDNESLLHQQSEANDNLSQMQYALESANSNVNELEAESGQLLDEIKDLKKSISTKSKELAQLQRLNRVTPDGPSINISDEIERIKQKTAVLRAENAQMAFELKRMEQKSYSDSLSPTSTLTLDEDELAAHILRSKLH